MPAQPSMSFRFLLGDSILAQSKRFERKSLPKDRLKMPAISGFGPSPLHRGARRQIGALCYRINVARSLEVALITTRQTRRWTIPKGWPMDGKAAHQSAKQEALEEAGLVGKVSKKVFGRFTYLKFLSDGRQVPCTVQVHLLRVESALDKFREQGQRELCWYDCFEAAAKVSEPDLKRMFHALHDRLRARIG